MGCFIYSRPARSRDLPEKTMSTYHQTRSQRSRTTDGTPVYTLYGH